MREQEDRMATAREGEESQEAQHDQLISELRHQGIRDEDVLRAMHRVPRHEFVLPEGRGAAYEDRPLPIGEGQTISQPYIVAIMSELSLLREDSRVLEVGTGCGYQTAILSLLAKEVFSIEIVEGLAHRARETLARLGFMNNVRLRVGDGYAGWKDESPFDAIVVTAAPKDVPAPLVSQLRVGGRMVIPVGELVQELRVLEKTHQGIVEKFSLPVRFVPMTGRAQGHISA